MQPVQTPTHTHKHTALFEKHIITVMHNTQYGGLSSSSSGNIPTREHPVNLPQDAARQAPELRYHFHHRSNSLIDETISAGVKSGRHRFLNGGVRL